MIGSIAAMLRCISLVTTIVSVATVSRHPLLLVVSFDGFRPDYVHPDVTPHLARFRDAAAAPPYIRSAFPTKTFVNHFTLATGLYSETHGVLDNYMFDRNGNTIHYTYEQFHYNEAVVPIWMQNEYSGDDRYSGVMMWSGSDFPYQGKTPTYIQKYNHSIPWTDRVDKVISWIIDEKNPANLVFAYFEEPDTTGHLKGVGSQEIKNQIVRVDATVKYILEKLKHEHLENKLNLIILSDHGMETITYDSFIFLDNYVSNNTQKILTSGPNAFVYPNSGKYDEVYTNISIGANNSGKFNVFKQNEIPDRWHLKNSPRLTGIIYLLAKSGYAFWNKYFKNNLDKTTPDKFKAGTHGYDNEDPQMRAMFMASGPMFKKNFIARPFDNVDLYPLISRMMNLKEPAGKVQPNGTIAGVEQLLAKSDAATSHLQVRGILLAVMLLHAVARPL